MHRTLLVTAAGSKRPRTAASSLAAARRAFQSAAHVENKLRLQAKDADEEGAALHDSTISNKEYLQHSKNEVRAILASRDGREALLARSGMGGSEEDKGGVRQLREE